MRLLKWIDQDQIGLTQDIDEDKRPPYAILSHTWAKDNSEEVTWAEVETEAGRKKSGYEKIRFCAEQARKDGINHFWVDTCCIDKTNLVELSTAITSMYRWYQDAVKCYVYLPDVSSRQQDPGSDADLLWLPDFQASRWFTRGWTLQEMLAPRIVEFFSRERKFLGDKKTLAQQIHKVTSIPVDALHASSLAQFSVSERMRWAETRQTKKPEDRAYSLLGIFDVSIAIIYGEGERHTFRRLQRALQEPSGTTTGSQHTHWMVPRTANPLFTGRQDLLQELEDTVRGALYCPWHRAQCRIVISGIGGQGKSEVCLQLARRLRQAFWAVLWIDVSTKDTAERSLLEAARRLDLSAHDWEDALYGIANLPQHWLLILDNADHPEIDYCDYFPDSRYGVIVMASRNTECEQYGADQIIALPGLDTKEAQELLLKAARIATHHHSNYDEDARQVATLLQSHPLALVQAGAYVARGHCTLADYPRVFEGQRRRLLTFRPTQARSRYGDVYATFEVSAKMLEVMDTLASRDALELLSLLAVCSPTDFPLYLFKIGWQGAQKVSPDLGDEAEDVGADQLNFWHVTQLPVICDTSSKEWDTYRLVEAINLLKTFSLVSTDAQNDSVHVSLHALVHAWARDRQQRQQQQSAWLQMGCLIACAQSDKSMTQDQERRLKPHVEALVGWSSTEMFSAGPVVMIVRTLVRCGRFLLEQRADAKLSNLLDVVFVTLGLDRLQVDPRWTILYELAARNSLHRGRTKEALVLLKQLVEAMKQTMAANHPNRVAAELALAVAYKDSGQVNEAIVLLGEVVKIQRRKLAADHRSRLVSKHAPAIAYQNNGQVNEAIALLEEIVDIKKQTLAAGHPSRRISQDILAIAYQNNGQVNEAITLLEEIVDIKKQTLAADHPSRLASQHRLAAAYKEVGQIKKAIPLLEEVVSIMGRTLAADHPSRLASQHNLATFLWALGERDGPLSLMTHVVDTHRIVLDEHHPDRLASEDWLAYFKQEMGSPDTE